MRLLVHACAVLTIAHALTCGGRECVLLQTKFDERRSEELEEAKKAAIEAVKVSAVRLLVHACAAFSIAKA